mgnify:CR=1 FL=1
MEVVKVSAKSVPKSVAGAIAAVIRENGEVEVQAVGAGVDLVCIPAFTTVSIDGEERTAMKFIVECR